MWKLLSSFALSLFTGKGGIIGSITAELDKVRADKMKAANDAERVALEGREAELSAQRDILIAEAQAGDRTSSVTRALIVSPVIVLLWKILVYDLALGEWTLGRTDPIPAELWTLITWMIAFYFAHSIVTRK